MEVCLHTPQPPNLTNLAGPDILNTGIGYFLEPGSHADPGSREEEMPLYEYRCRACGAEFEQLVRWNTSPEEIECPHCGRREAEKRLSRFAARGTDSGSRRDAACGPIT